MKRKLNSTVIALAVPMLLTACGSRSGDGPVPRVNGAPVLSAIGSQTIDQDTPTAALVFSVSDDSGVVTLTAATSDASIVPTSGIVIGGSGNNRTLTITPAEDATGQVNVTLTATDLLGLPSALVVPVTVRAVQRSIASYTLSTFAQMENDDPAKVSGFTFVQDADDETTFDPLLQ